MGATEYTLGFMSDPDMRKRNRRGLLKGEQLHALARDLIYGRRGRLNSRDWLQQKHPCSCLTLVIACIIYWQAKEIHRVIQTHVPPEHIDLKLLSHISPVSRDKIAICLLCAIGLLARQARAAGPPESASVPGLGGAMVPRRLPDRERNVLV